MAQKPDWWPKNPYPVSIFPMPEERYPEIVPDPELRTALSGMLGRRFWDIASEAIWAAMYRWDRVAKRDDHQVLDLRQTNTGADTEEFKERISSRRDG